MSRYLVLIILNIPLIVIGIVNSVVSYKVNQTGRRKLMFRLLMWLSILLALVLVEPIYNYLFSNNLTETEPLSLFDVMQITGIVGVFLIANQAYVKVERLEKRTNDLQQELAILFSKNDIR